MREVRSGKNRNGNLPVGPEDRYHLDGQLFGMQVFGWTDRNIRRDGPVTRDVVRASGIPAYFEVFSVDVASAAYGAPVSGSVAVSVRMGARHVRRLLLFFLRIRLQGYLSGSFCHNIKAGSPVCPEPVRGASGRTGESQFQFLFLIESGSPFGSRTSFSPAGSIPVTYLGLRSRTVLAGTPAASAISSRDADMLRTIRSVCGIR